MTAAIDVAQSCSQIGDDIDNGRHGPVTTDTPRRDLVDDVQNGDVFDVTSPGDVESEPVRSAVMQVGADVIGRGQPNFAVLVSEERRVLSVMVGVADEKRERHQPSQRRQ